MGHQDRGVVSSIEGAPTQQCRDGAPPGVPVAQAKGGPG